MSETTNLHPGLSVDCVIFGFHENELKVLMLKMKQMDKWALPGGFVNIKEDVDKEAINILQRRTGLKDIFLHQFHLFGNVSRNNQAYVDKLVKKGVIEPDMKEWFQQRFITVGYYALVEFANVQEPTPDNISDKCEWLPLTELPDLILDHSEIIHKAHQTLKTQLIYQPIGINLLPEKFTMPELQALYETLLEKELDRRNFRRKMLAYDILIQTDERRKGGAHKAPILYKFDKDKYHQAIEKGLKSGW
ncbi:NUDIX hydrolase [Marinoscillum pacificum]|uniref:NUDIX hydrolase n=1 Tax=Marinoscillum pacificum TaxID=392723 RepID=UPI002157026B|nr:NUDIX domain-containing protein [Marinoscillum pacificum]